MTRKEVYEIIKNNNLNAWIKSQTGANYTNLSTDVLVGLLSLLDKAATGDSVKTPQEEVKSPENNPSTAFEVLVDILLDKGVLDNEDITEIALAEDQTHGNSLADLLYSKRIITKEEKDNL